MNLHTYTHTYVKGVKYNLEEHLLASQWTLCLEVPYHSAVTLAGSLSRCHAFTPTRMLVRSPLCLFLSLFRSFSLPPAPLSLSFSLSRSHTLLSPDYLSLALSHTLQRLWS
jgi:hypothetical protein